MVHGSGEGVLRRAIRDYLGREREVKSFFSAIPPTAGTTSPSSLHGIGGTGDQRGKNKRDPRPRRQCGGDLLLCRPEAGGSNFQGLCPFHAGKTPPSTSTRTVSSLPLLRVRRGRGCVRVCDEDWKGFLVQAPRNWAGASASRWKDQPPTRPKRNTGGGASCCCGSMKSPLIFIITP